MKKVIFLLAFCITITTFAQQGINYKAIVKDNIGNVVANDLIQVQFSILQGVAQINVYQETHTLTTDANGLIIVNIGEGTTSDVFADINWGTDDHFLNVQIDTGAGLTDIGTTQFMAVPYALQAEKAANVSGLEALNEGNGVGWRLIGKDPIYYGDIGENAVDLSNSDSTNPSVEFGGTGIESFAVGSNTSATGNGSVAMGNHTEASGEISTAMGGTTEAQGDFSTAMGKFTLASEFSTTAMGESTWAEGMNSTAMGYLSHAKGQFSTAIGNNTKAESYISTAIGRFNIGGGNSTGWITSDPLFEIGNGTSGGNRSNALTVLKNGTITAPSFDLNEITDDKALITKEYAEANFDDSSGLEALNEGNGTGYRIAGRNPSYYGSIGESAVDLSLNESNSTIRGATGQYATALGRITTASGKDALATGYFTTASGEYSTTLGTFTIASGESATAIGTQSTASGEGSTSIGGGTIASGNFSVAMGFGSKAEGQDSFSMGFITEASGNESTAIGYQLKAEALISTAIGRYNVGGGNATSWVSTDPLFEIGNGTSNANRANALTILKNGKIGVAKSSGINAKLDIDHASSQTSPQINIRETSGTFARLNFSNTNSSDYWAIAGSLDGNTITDRINFYHSDVGDIFTIEGDGDIKVNGSVVHSSDRRLKNDIETIPYGLDAVLQLQPKAYHWKAKPDQENKSLGLIAQEVQTVIKGIVHTADDENKTLSVSYTELIPVLIKAIQEQQEIIDSQQKLLDSEKQKNIEQENQFQTLLKRVERLENDTSQ
ncbi:tail fiber domain-containing protein [Lacinutrix iliipiscaria]|uniref:Tail fiber domain-containing protein n=1 Tax=Lacinutrix iliipiscaria TaxID=1230532 RepID=A0ABW5WNG4_9FLAO